MMTEISIVPAVVAHGYISFKSKVGFVQRTVKPQLTPLVPGKKHTLTQAMTEIRADGAMVLL